MLFEKSNEFFGRYGFGEVITLDVIDSEPVHGIKLGLGFDALGNDLHVHVMSYADHTLHHVLDLVIPEVTLGKGEIELDIIGGHIYEIIKVGPAGPEIIKRE